MTPQNTRVAQPSLLVLLALADGPKHGWAITGEIERISGNRPGPGTLYGAIAGLEKRGLVRALAGEGRRRPYELTEAGDQQLRSALRELSLLTTEATRRLRLRETTA